jgi:hypothetical protein
MFGENLNIDPLKGLFYSSRKKVFDANFKKRTPMIGRSGSMAGLLSRKSITQLTEKVPESAKLPVLPVLQFRRRTVQADDAEMFRRAAKTIVKTIVIDNTPDDWIREIHGGVKMWVNQKTGEVSLEKPHDAAESTRRVANPSGGRSGKHNNNFHLAGGSMKSTKSVRGTASMLYNKSEVGELFEILDERSVKANKCILPSIQQ